MIPGCGGGVSVSRYHISRRKRDIDKRFFAMDSLARFIDVSPIGFSKFDSVPIRRPNFEILLLCHEEIRLLCHEEIS